MQSSMLVKTDSSCITKSRTLDLVILLQLLAHYSVRLYVFASLLIISTAFRLVGTALVLPYGYVVRSNDNQSRYAQRFIVP